MDSFFKLCAAIIITLTLVGAYQHWFAGMRAGGVSTFWSSVFALYVAGMILLSIWYLGARI